MEFFILALVGVAQLSSMYDLQRRASLQPGSIRHQVEKLERLGLLVRGEASSRRRRKLLVTERGLNHLRNSWQMCLRDYPDTETIFRAACVALLMDNPSAAAAYLHGQALTNRSREEEKSMEAERLGKIQRDPLSTYAWMRVLIEARRRGAESQALSTASQFLEERLQPDGGFQP
jgi:DNA-binding MarR family transcriptional regulator